MRKCKYRQCDEQIAGAKHYCSDMCKRKEGWARESDDVGKPKKKYRNERYFTMVTGSAPIRSRGAGRRSGHMVKGSMAAQVWATTEEIAPVTYENLKRHFYGNKFNLNYAIRGDGERIYREDFDSGKIKYE